jgi:hypothetical protein
MPLEAHENEDISLDVSRSPQEGQFTVSSSWEERINCSKVLPHLLHLNSYIGIFLLHSISAHGFYPSEIDLFMRTIYGKSFSKIFKPRAEIFPKANEAETKWLGGLTLSDSGYN